MSRDLNSELQALKKEVKDMLQGPEEALSIFWQEYCQHGDPEVAINEMFALSGHTAFNAAYVILYPPYLAPVLTCDDLTLAPLNPDDENDQGYQAPEESAQKWEDLKRLREEGRYPVNIDGREVKFPVRVGTEKGKVFQLRTQNALPN